MSGILRNTLRLVGTAKYAPITNSTKYLRPTTLTTSRINSSLVLEPNNYVRRSHHAQAIQNSTGSCSTIQAAGKKISSIFAEKEVKTLNINHNFTVSLDSGEVGLIIPKIFFGRKDLIFPSTFNIELNDKSIKPKSNKIAAEEEKTSFKLGNWYGSLDGGKLTLKLKDSNETFILKHTFYVKAENNPPEYSEEEGLLFNPPKLDSNVKVYSAKITSKPDGSKPLHRTYPPVGSKLPPELLQRYGRKVPGALLKENDDEVTDGPNSDGRMKLQFPMTVVLEGGQQKIKIKDTDDNFNVYHKVEIRAYKEPAETITNSGSNTGGDKLSKIGILGMQLNSGNLLIEEIDSTGQRILIRQEVDIEIDLDSEIPSILMNSHVKRAMCIH
ncbi:hypothetical protein HCN44_001999 [Aphidius gifuensis]|uniref:Uncharacterized protein n=1 Tax=Aphidius gifuensis TaxID=684658 RepID=A0A834Y401_APHGI|nr:uncharacterized protein LOC122847330 [Aphidius gifuensis]KAF7996367.1 hypothetical protein HCN44_001999 [Aphidius gifuensis]